MNTQNEFFSVSQSISDSNTSHSLTYLWHSDSTDSFNNNANLKAAQNNNIPTDVPVKSSCHKISSHNDFIYYSSYKANLRKAKAMTIAMSSKTPIAQQKTISDNQIILTVVILLAGIGNGITAIILLKNLSKIS